MRSKNKYDAFNWIKRVIASCTSLVQMSASKQLIGNFQKQYADYQLTMELDDVEHEKFMSLTNHHGSKK